MTNTCYKSTFYLILSCCLLTAGSLHAQEQETSHRHKEIKVFGSPLDPVIPPVHRAYVSSGFEGNILSTAMLERPGKSAKLTTPRYTIFFNGGMNLNYNFSNAAGFFVGLSIKNIGFIEKYDNPDSTVKRRVYALGIPIGLKFGNMMKGNYVMLGGGVDFPFNYKEKGFVKRSDKDKFNEWFSDRTPAVMPYVFVGFRLNPGVSLKFQYYPGNFLNPDYTTTENGMTIKPYDGYKVNLMFVSFAVNIPYFPHTDYRK